MASNNIEQAIYVRVTGDTDVSAAVGNRVFFVQAENESPMPYVVYSVVSDPHEAFSFDAVNSGQARVQFNVVAEDRYQVLEIAHNIRKRLRHYSGDWDGLAIKRCTVGGTRLTRELSRGGEGRTDVYQATFDALPIYVDAS